MRNVAGVRTQVNLFSVYVCHDQNASDAPQSRHRPKGHHSHARQSAGSTTVERYVETCYIPAALNYSRLTEHNAQEAFIIKELHDHLNSDWKNIRIAHPVRNLDGPFRVGDHFKVTVSVYLGNITPDEVEVELCYGKTKSVDELETVRVAPMHVVDKQGGGNYVYGCDLTCSYSGRYGLTARVIPKGDNQLKYAPGLITWA